MSSADPNLLLHRKVAALKVHGLIPAIVAPLQATAEKTQRDLQQRVIEQIDAFSASSNPDLVPELGMHIQQILAEICRLLDDEGPCDLEFVRQYSQTGAQQRFPLEAILHTYRCSHRIISDWIRDAAISAADSAAMLRRVVAAASDFAAEFNDVISTLATSEYVLHTRLLAESEGDRRTELLNTLLSGYDESDSQTAHLLRSAGYLEQRQSFCVAVARSVDPREMQSTARAQRMAEAIETVLRDLPLRSLVGVREGLVMVVISGTRRQSGWTAAQALLAERIYPQLSQVGTAALIGLSNDAPSTSHIRRALNEARLALDFASVANRVMAFSEIAFRQMIIRHARDNIQSALPAWLELFQVADRKARGVLSGTLHAYANANMNALQAAKVLSVHPNTIYSRMQRIADLTGKNALAYHDLTELLLVIESANGSLEPVSD